MLKLYNTLSKTIDEVPTGDRLNLYTCGPTVYNYAHIGNLRAFILSDFLYRTLKYHGYNPQWVMNITDIDDKTIKGTLAEYGENAGVKELYEFTGKYFKAFLQDLRAVNIPVDEIRFFRVTDKMTDIQNFITALIDKHYAYRADDGSTYFSIEKYQKDFGDYGQLVGKKFLQGKKIGARVAVDEYEKDNLSDFALWKKHNPQTDGQIFWDHPVLGKGRPGWHIECSVINYTAFTGASTHLHTGGVDLIFPHHTNEIAQSQAIVGKGNFVKHWFHSEHLLVDSKKMAKRDGNVFVLGDLLAKGFSGTDLRYLFLTSGFAVQQNFTWEALLSAHQALERLQIFALSGQAGQVGCAGYEKDFIELTGDNLNMSEVLGLVWRLVDDKKMPLGAKINSLLKFDKVLGLNLGSPIKPIDLPPQIKNLLQEREEAREQKDYARSDEIRKLIENLGYEIMDTPQGQKVKKKISRI